MESKGFATCTFHPLPPDLARPATMNNPFDYEPDETVLAACREVQEVARETGGEAKMFGVLVVEDAVERLGYLAAFSGQMEGRFDWPGFVPPVFDYLHPDDHFKLEEARISELNREVERLEGDDGYVALCRQREQLLRDGQQRIAQATARMRMAKQLRDRRRQEGYLTASEQAEMTRESQFLKAEVHRAKRQAAAQLAEVEARLKPVSDRIAQLKAERRQRSDALQAWLFDQFQLVNDRGEHRSLTDIFKHTPMRVPPSGAGECCEPKLLQYAYRHGLRPLQMGMFWWGESPKQEVRHHGNFYPACSGKCKPILEWMITSLTPGPSTKSLTPSPSRKERGVYSFAVSIINWRSIYSPLLARGAGGEAFRGEVGGEAFFLYEDAHLAVVSKPAGMLSVPGRTDAPSLLSLMCEKWPDADPNLIIVHRLDQDTSGLMVVTRTRKAHHCLQRQFADHEVEKTYIARLEQAKPEIEKFPMKSGKIELPLLPDVLNRPFQKVDFEQGREAVTEYRFLDENHVELRPKTGRTHQLRVHCAHADGLGRPIVGDRLYGHRADRLYLHASVLTFRHPATGQTLTFTQEPPFYKAT